LHIAASPRLFLKMQFLMILESWTNFRFICCLQFICADSQRPQNRHTSDGGALPRGCPDNKCCHSDELESYVTSFVERSLSEARKIVGEAMQVGYT
jgi:hypothetical protein